jgi:crotonobetainyl-CoA:carnitine CoA-transferase CaiB-like acyl-CoA transferase
MGEVMPYVSEWTAVELQHHEGDRGGFDIWTNHVFHTADGVGVVLVGNPTRLFPGWIKALRGDESLLTDERFATEAARVEHTEATLAVLAELVRTFRDFAAIGAAVEGWPMLVAEVRSIADLAATPWAEDRGLIAEALPGLPLPAAAWRSDAATIGVSGPPPRLGEHSRAILRDAGFSDTEIDDLVRADAVL